MPFHINQNIFMHMSLLERHMSTPSRINIAACMWLMMGTIRTVVTTNQKLQESHEQLCGSHYQLSKHPLFLKNISCPSVMTSSVKSLAVHKVELLS